MLFVAGETELNSVSKSNKKRLAILAIIIAFRYTRIVSRGRIASLALEER